MSQWSEAQPDVVLLVPRADFYRSELASGTDALLVVEVSDTTLRYDRDVKVPLYARHGVPATSSTSRSSGPAACP